MISEADLSVAVDLAAWFVRAGYPYPARPTLELDGDYPLVVTWDDRRAVLLVVACTAWMNDMPDALALAVGHAVGLETRGDAPTGALGVALCANYIHCEDQAVISAIPIKQFLGGEG